MSARAADASPVVYARPKDVSSLGSPETPLMLSFSNRKRIEHWVRDKNVRRHIGIKADMEPKRADGTPAESPMAWISGNQILLARSSKNASQSFFWTDLSRSDYKPLDLDNFQPQFRAAIDDVDLDRLNMERLKLWDASKSPTKQNSTATLKFDDGEVRVLISEQEPFDIKLGRILIKARQISFRVIQSPKREIEHGAWAI